MTERPPRWAEVVIGLLLALSGVAGVSQYDDLRLKLLFTLVVISGLLWAATGGPGTKRHE